MKDLPCILAGLGLILALLLTGCAGGQTPDSAIPSATPDKTSGTLAPGKTGASMANPAAVYCESQGYRLQPVVVADGGQSAICIFPDGSQCDEWAYYRGQCGPATPVPQTENKAVEACKNVVARDAGIDASQVTLFSLEQITWPNSCLGLAAPGEICLAVETPGFRVILTAGQDHYTFHTDLTGENIRRETAGTHPM